MSNAKILAKKILMVDQTSINAFYDHIKSLPRVGRECARAFSGLMVTIGSSQFDLVVNNGCKK